jgi:predicted secreted protein
LKNNNLPQAQFWLGVFVFQRYNINMMTIKGWIVAGVFAGLISVVCVFCYAAESQDSGNAATVMTVEAGQNFNIILDSSPATGLEWQLAGPLDENILTLSGSKYVFQGFASDSVDIAQSMAGVEGKQQWTFQALKTGKVTVFFQRVQPWDKQVLQDAEMRIFTIEIIEPRN